MVLFVGEALVGNEAIDQLVKFNAALADHSASDNPHTIDGIVLTKFDTIDDKVGSAISMTYISGQPIVFVGTGQTYTDLKSLNSKVKKSKINSGYLTINAYFLLGCRSGVDEVEVQYFDYQETFVRKIFCCLLQRYPISGTSDRWVYK